MTNVYEVCPIYQNEKYLLRLVSPNDCNDLLKVYSDKKAVSLFNSDNCNGDYFYYETIERMKQAIDFWLFSYNYCYFVRWTIVDKTNDTAVGTIELFNRKSNDHFNNCGLLRLDLHSNYEKNNEIKNILSLIIKPAYDLFNCKMIATKAVSSAKERRNALTELGFLESNQKFIGHDGTVYDSYFEIDIL